jgi:putative oxidoreductase
MTTKTKKPVITYVLWTVQVLLAALFLFGGVMKLISPIEALEAQQSTFSGAFLRFIGLVEFLGAIGLIVPAATRILPFLTPLAAIGLAIVMVGATWFNVVLQGIGAGSITAIIGGLLLFVAYRRRDSFATRGAPSLQDPAPLANIAGS